MALIILFLVLVGCNAEQSMAYDVNSITKFRADKNQAFIEEVWSPIPVEERLDFKGLNYFPVSPTWAVPARYIPETHVDTVQMTTSKDELRTALRIGKFVFTIQGTEYTLWSFKFLEPVAGEVFFIPFKDATCGTDAYELGRYVEVPVSASGQYVIDFNMAYNPYCAYSSNYSCPLVPFYNTLSVPVTAGEKAWH
ncbi:MAG: DUF1684 domain-containing protein [Chlorobi bacterium]|nr:MAG: DUF1684 domain-containing protein [Bacteroidota bacterium]KXK35756.1 MAG: secreted protein [Chlorobi bacterium OLB6]MBE2265282.1 DUF1684 domain-containing protein [Flavobacteriales bacterium]MBL1160255.1 DUF1684 domain-containing protein [Chlorobiota bacterium]MBW7853393.1 DUF1684 domain-containing protein [Candidatus Kapabacteria bacterium]MCC6330440.1 DUF1684 domain-containing protein [Ignavibacteria bacterium]